jgi:hypothetical protein
MAQTKPTAAEGQRKRAEQSRQPFQIGGFFFAARSAYFLLLIRHAEV